MTFSDLFGLIPGGPVAIGSFLLVCVLSVVFVVVKFLHYQSVQDVRLNAISERCHNTQLEMMNAYTENLKTVSETNRSISEALAESIKTMDNSIRSLNNSINQMIGKLE